MTAGGSASVNKCKLRLNLVEESYQLINLFIFNITVLILVLYLHMFVLLLVVLQYCEKSFCFHHWFLWDNCFVKVQQNVLAYNLSNILYLLVYCFNYQKGGSTYIKCSNEFIISVH